MCDSCGCNGDIEQMSAAERAKAHGDGLRGTIGAELLEDTPIFSDDAGVLLKFHGVYQQDDRDRRKEARRLGLDKHHMMMIRTRIPGGIVSPDAYLAHDRSRRSGATGRLRVTTRQDFQLHGVLKGDLKAAIRAINDALLTTLGGCGDVERNIMCCPAPWHDRLHREIHARLAGLVDGLAPVTRAYSEIWLDGELATSTEPAPDPLYGERYLPRKFKTALAIEGDNCVDIYANDLGLVAHPAADGTLDGFDVLVGGGLGRTANKPNTWPAVAQPLGYIAAHHAVEVARAVVSVQRDYGNRADRRHARLKYLLADRGIAWFRTEVGARTLLRDGAAAAAALGSVEDHLGWHEQGDGRHLLRLVRRERTHPGHRGCGLAVRVARGRRDTASADPPDAAAERAHRRRDRCGSRGRDRDPRSVECHAVRGSAERDPRLDGVPGLADMRACGRGVGARHAGAHPRDHACSSAMPVCGTRASAIG